MQHTKEGLAPRALFAGVGTVTAINEIGIGLCPRRQASFLTA
jgi:hypothetical protein